MRRFHGLLALTVVLLCTFARAEKVDPPMQAAVPLRSGEIRRGNIIGVDENGFQLTRGGLPQTVPWTTVQPRAALGLCERLMGKAAAPQWVRIGENLLKSPDGA